MVNFDLPRTLRAYTHRVGRTARAGQSGTALSLVGPEEVARIEGLAAKQAARNMPVVQPLPFNLSQVEGFRYTHTLSYTHTHTLSLNARTPHTDRGECVSERDGGSEHSLSLSRARARARSLSLSLALSPTLSLSFSLSLSLARVRALSLPLS